MSKEQKTNGKILQLLDLPDEMLQTISLNLSLQDLNNFILSNKRLLQVNTEKSEKVKSIYRLVYEKELAKVKLVASDSTSFIVNNVGDVYAWGSNEDGLLGAYTGVDKSIKPVKVPLSNIVDLDAKSHALALDGSGNVYAWGSNKVKEVENSKNQYLNYPVQVPGLPKIQQVSAGDQFSVVLDVNGNVWSWGINSDGQLGHGDIVDYDTPTQITGLPKIKRVSAGSGFVLALAENGNVYSWGNNENGQLGLGDEDDYVETPTQVDLKNIVFLQAGYSFSVFEDINGKTYACGDNDYGQCGFGEEIEGIEYPNLVDDIPPNSFLFVGEFNMFVKKDKNTVVFGLNDEGQLGIGSYKNAYDPTRFRANIRNVSAGFNHTLFLDENATLFGMGNNEYGQLGAPTGRRSNFNTPIVINVPVLVR